MATGYLHEAGIETLNIAVFVQRQHSKHRVNSSVFVSKPGVKGAIRQNFVPFFITDDTAFAGFGSPAFIRASDVLQSKRRSLSQPTGQESEPQNNDFAFLHNLTLLPNHQS